MRLPAGTSTDDAIGDSAAPSRLGGSDMAGAAAITARQIAGIILIATHPSPAAALPSMILVPSMPPPVDFSRAERHGRRTGSLKPHPPARTRSSSMIGKTDEITTLN